MADEKSLASTNNLTELFKSNYRAITKSIGSEKMAQRLINLAIEGVRKVPDLQKCDSMDVFNKLRQTIELGLEPFTPLHHAVLLPFKNTQQNRYDCTLIIEYQGLIQLAQNSGLLKNIYSNVVYENEPYDIKGNIIEHKRLPPSQRGAKMIAAYTVAELKDGAIRSCWMWAEEILAVKGKSKAKNNGPWADPDFEPQMWCKTTVRRLAKTLPLSPAFVAAANLDEKEEFGFQSAIDVTPPKPEEKKTMADAVKPAKAAAEKPKNDPGQQQQDAHPQDDHGQEGENTPNVALFNRIMEICQGDMFKADEICEKVTLWNNTSLKIADIHSCNPKRAAAALRNLEEMIKRGDIQ